MYFKEKIMNDIDNYTFFKDKEKNENVRSELNLLIDLTFFNKFIIVRELNPREVFPFPPEGLGAVPLFPVNEYYYNITECMDFDNHKERIIPFYREIFDNALDYIGKEDFNYLMSRVIDYSEQGDWDKEKGMSQLVNELEQDTVLRKILKIIGYTRQIFRD